MKFGSVLFAFITAISVSLSYADESSNEPTSPAPGPATNELHPSVPTEPPIDLRTAVQRALKNNNAILQAREKLNQARNDKSVVRAAVFPTVNLNVNAAENKSAVGNLGQAPFGGNSYNQYTTDLQLVQPLLAFGVFAAVSVADYNIQMYEKDLELAERKLTADTVQAFYRVLLNQRLLNNLEKVQKVVDESLSTAERRLHTGRGQLLDVLQVKTQMALLKPQIEDARNQLESAGAQLATFLAENGKYYLQLRGKLRALHLKDVQSVIKAADARLPELERVRLQRAQLHEQKWVTYGKHLPYLKLVGDYGSQSFTKAEVLSANNRDWGVSLQLTIPIFSGFSSIYEQRSLSAQQRELDFGERDLENTLALQQVQSLKGLQSTEASLVSAEEADDLANQSMKEANRNFRLATIDFLQFLTVEQSTVQADSSLDNIKFNNIIAFTGYFVATGQPLAKLIDILTDRNR